jgi:hypothetical protein
VSAAKIAQRVVFLDYNPGREIDGVKVDVADNGKLDELIAKGWRITQITATSAPKGGVFAVIEREEPKRVPTAHELETLAALIPKGTSGRGGDRI